MRYENYFVCTSSSPHTELVLSRPQTYDSLPNNDYVPSDLIDQPRPAAPTVGLSDEAPYLEEDDIGDGVLVRTR